jgi:large subunit ribosomal protein L32
VVDFEDATLTLVAQITSTVRAAFSFIIIHSSFSIFFFSHILFAIFIWLAIFLLFAIVCRIMVVRMRHTRSHTANRRSHHALTTPEMAVCKNCGAMHRPHHMCLACGFYNGRQVLDLAAKAKAREARMQAKREMIKAESGVPETEPAAK